MGGTQPSQTAKSSKIQTLSLDQFFKLEVCILCYNKSKVSICASCSQNKQSLLYLLEKKI